MSWYDKLDEFEIKMLKENMTPFGLCPERKREMFYAIHADDISVLQMYDSSFGWILYNRAFGFPMKAANYRLDPDWQRPEPEKKEGHWEYCEVKRDYDSNSNLNLYSFSYRKNRRGLYSAQTLVGFGGFEFEEKPGEWHWSLMGWNVIHEAMQASAWREMDTVIPATPKRVRFWVE